jgi:hypothetical protein
MTKYDFCTYKFYDSKNRRLAIFGYEYEPNRYAIKVITCSKKDVFSKRVAKQLFEEGKGTFFEWQFLKNEINSSKAKGFISVCKYNYYMLIPLNIHLEGRKVLDVKVKSGKWNSSNLEIKMLL